VDLGAVYSTRSSKIREMYEMRRLVCVRMCIYICATPDVQLIYQDQACVSRPLKPLRIVIYEVPSTRNDEPQVTEYDSDSKVIRSPRTGFERRKNRARLTRAKETIRNVLVTHALNRMLELEKRLGQRKPCGRDPCRGLLADDLNLMFVARGRSKTVPRRRSGSGAM
jgi:hypothetical protein